MGCDGGTIPTRDELVRTKKRPEQKDKDSERLYQWQHCHLTQEPLTRPVVSCQMGGLYNKEAVIRMLLDRKAPDAADNGAVDKAPHIRSLKDVRELDLTPNPSYDAKRPSVGDGYVDRLVSPWICPITGLEMNGRFRFVYDWDTGKTVSERAHKMVKADDPGKIADPVTINPPAGSEEETAMRDRMAQRKAAAKAEKKKNKRKNNGEADATASNGGEPVAGPSKEALAGPSKSKKSKSGDVSKKPAPSSTVTSSDETNTALQNDPSKSDVYKSLFSSHKSAQNLPKGNWVTFDPRYN